MSIPDNTNDFYFRLDQIAQDVQDVMRHRMEHNGDYRPLYVYVSYVDGGHTVGHAGQHEGFWRNPNPITSGLSYNHVARFLESELQSAPLFAIQSR